MPIPLPGLCPKPDFVGHVLKFAIPEIVIEPLRNRWIGLRMAIGSAAVMLAALIVRRRPERVVRHDQVEQAIVVVVEPCRLDAQGFGGFASSPDWAVTSVKVPLRLLW